MALIKPRPSQPIAWPSRFHIDNGLAHLQTALLNGFRPNSENTAVNYQNIVRQSIPEPAAFEAKKKAGRPQVQLDRDTIQKMLKCGFSLRAIARHFKCHEKSVRRAMKRKNNG